MPNHFGQFLFERSRFAPALMGRGLIHGDLIFPRRVRVLARHAAELLPTKVCVLDIGCGSGIIAAKLLAERPDLAITGIDTLVRNNTHIKVIGYDGHRLPFPDRSFDIAMLIDVLHHTNDPFAVMTEALRVAPGGLLIKDHSRQGMLAQSALRFMDFIGNARFGVARPNAFWPLKLWQEAFSALSLTPAVWRDRLGLYVPPLNWIFERHLHFMTLLVPSAKTPIQA